MYMLKICRCCDAIVGELDTDDSKNLRMDHSIEITGNVAYTLCSRCMRELDIHRATYYQ
ncbi:hypothetical protein LPY66_02520 [Dehalobacter sp. DCM]|uniref:hypothetical protein n=1 Tax=Dehalobacter sp. DCM TaxID=2907827 RepID=UPI0030817690|nr:hypothetical protein LPY66_02520 [Dehalobacter sp. DCM]